MAIQPLVEVQGGWVDLYAATGITVGTQLLVQNFFSRSPVSLADTAGEPTAATGRIRIDPTQFYQNDSGDVGAWAYCATFAQISVQEA